MGIYENWKKKSRKLPNHSSLQANPNTLLDENGEFLLSYLLPCEINRCAHQYGEYCLFLRKYRNGNPLSLKEAQKECPMLFGDGKPTTDLFTKSRREETARRQCYACKGFDFWKSGNGKITCRKCHPPVKDVECKKGIGETE